MMMFALGFAVAVVLMIIAGNAATKFAVKKGWYASAMWSEKEQIWKVRGRYLAVSNKIFNGIREEALTGEKKVKYIN